MGLCGGNMLLLSLFSLIIKLLVPNSILLYDSGYPVVQIKRLIVLPIRLFFFLSERIERTLLLNLLQTVEFRSYKFHISKQVLSF